MFQGKPKQTPVTSRHTADRVEELTGRSVTDFLARFAPLAPQAPCQPTCALVPAEARALAKWASMQRAGSTCSRMSGGRRITHLPTPSRSVLLQALSFSMKCPCYRTACCATNFLRSEHGRRRGPMLRNTPPFAPVALFFSDSPTAA